MAKAKIYGMKTKYTPNTRRDARFHKKAYQRPREIAQRVQVAGQIVKEMEAHKDGGV